MGGMGGAGIGQVQGGQAQGPMGAEPMGQGQMGQAATGGQGQMSPGQMSPGPMYPGAMYPGAMYPGQPPQGAPMDPTGPGMGAGFHTGGYLGMAQGAPVYPHGYPPAMAPAPMMGAPMAQGPAYYGPVYAHAVYPGQPMDPMGMGQGMGPMGMGPMGMGPMGMGQGMGPHAGPKGPGMTELMEELASGGNGLSSLGKMLNLDDTEFWKGALVGAAAVLLLTNESVQNALFKTGARAKQAVKTGLDTLGETAGDLADKVKEAAK
jgi:hypothetical protein